MKTLAFVHTLAALVEEFDRMAREVLPGVARLHTLDEPLLARIMKRGALIAADTERLASHVAAARDAGADAVLVTCSTLSPCVDDVRQKTPLRVFKIDEAMFREAARRGKRIGILATHAATVEPTRSGLLAASATLEIEARVIDAAMKARSAGRLDDHDRVIADAVDDLAPRCDIVVLAQASMARALSLIDESRWARILTSPQTAMEAVAEYLK
jgi:hypothetical protein